MKQDSIVQYIAFITDLELRAFAPQWEQYASDLWKVQGDRMLLESTEAKSKFKYICRHEYVQSDSRQQLMMLKTAKYFPDQKVKVLLTGGYSTVKLSDASVKDTRFTKIIAFISHLDKDDDFYFGLPYRSNIYDAYFENCTYGRVIEFFLVKQEVDELMEKLKNRTGISIGSYKKSSSLKSVPSL